MSCKGVRHGAPVAVLDTCSPPPPKGTGLAYDSITNHNQPMQETNGEDLGGGEVVDSNPYGVINECATIANNYPPPPPPCADW